jgi:TonB family protein
MKRTLWIAAAATLLLVDQAAAQPSAPDTGKEPVVISNPDWLHKPTGDELLAVWPLKAAQAGLGGKAMIKCIVTTTGLLRNCTVLSETPPGEGFGTAAVVLARTLLMKPAMTATGPVEGEVSVPINFHKPSKELHDFLIGGENKSVTILAAPVWAKAPTVAEILAELGKKVGDRFADGQVVMQCSVDKATGRLSSCLVATYSTGMTQFRGAARSLTSKFQIAPETLANIKNNVNVSLAFSFPDMTSAVWSARYLNRTAWTRVPQLDGGQKTFPDEAAKAGLKTGSATVDCVVGADGGLTKCAIASESTPGVGFGPVAVQIAQTFATNPWTDEGLPAEGAHVKLPIKMVDADAIESVTPAAAADAAAAAAAIAKP